LKGTFALNKRLHLPKSVNSLGSARNHGPVYCHGLTRPFGFALAFNGFLGKVDTGENQSGQKGDNENDPNYKPKISQKEKEKSPTRKNGKQLVIPYEACQLTDVFVHGEHLLSIQKSQAKKAKSYHRI